MPDRVAGVVRSVGARFGFLVDDAGSEFYFTTERLPAGLRLWPGDRVSFVPLWSTVSTSTRRNGKPLATLIRRAP